MSPWFPYDVWVAADLFIQAGVPHDAVLARLGLEPAGNEAAAVGLIAEHGVLFIWLNDQY